MSSQVDNTLACPSCGEINHIEKMGTDAGCLCWKCHYPLFWAHVGERRPNDDGIDRSAVDLGTRECPNCHLINELNAPVCLKCNFDFRPKPVEPVVVPPPPPPPPVPIIVPQAKRLIWPWVALGVALVIGIGLLIWLLVAVS